MPLFAILTPKGADNAIFIYEIIHKSLAGTGSAGSFEVMGYTKNLEDAGSEGTSFEFESLGADFFRAKPTNLKQLVRFRITLTPREIVSSPNGVCYRFLPPTWYDKAV